MVNGSFSGNGWSKPLHGMTALVTGAAQGVGKGIALELVRAGCAVAINHLSEPGLAKKTVEEIWNEGGEAFPVRADVGNFSDRPHV